MLHEKDIMAKQKHYTKEFQLQAANLVIREGYSQAEAAKRLGVSSGSIAMWIVKFRESGELDESKNVKAESKELKKLRKENRRLNLEVELLEETVRHFARRSI